MILAGEKLLQLVKEKKLVEGLCERERKNPEGAGFDLRLGAVHRIFGEAFLGIEERHTASAETLAEFNPQKREKITINPGECYLVTTYEKVNLPPHITANFWLRSTLYRSGIILSGGNVAPGYEGTLSFLLYNAGKCRVEIELGARIVHILFWEVKGKTNLYRGQWKGGRVTAPHKEKQV
jgi:deoxycytidine triphosphate deaminase